MNISYRMPRLFKKQNPHLAVIIYFVTPSFNSSFPKSNFLIIPALLYIGWQCMLHYLHK